MVIAKTLMSNLPETCSKCHFYETPCEYYNCPDYDGNVVWCGKDVYEKCYINGCCLALYMEEVDANSRPENCPLVEFDEMKLDDKYRYMGDNTILDTKINEKLHPCPYEGYEGACPYYVYFDDYGFYCYERECCAMEEGK